MITRLVFVLILGFFLLGKFQVDINVSELLELGGYFEFEEFPEDSQHSKEVFYTPQVFIPRSVHQTFLLPFFQECIHSRTNFFVSEKLRGPPQVISFSILET